VHEQSDIIPDKLIREWEFLDRLLLLILVERLQRMF